MAIKDETKTYRMRVYYGGSIYTEVEANNEDEACQKAEDYCNKLSDDDFLMALDPQCAEIEVIEEI